MTYQLSIGSFPDDETDYFLKWGDDKLGTSSERITWSLSLAGLSYGFAYTEEQFISAAQDAFDAWASVAQLTFEFVQGDADIDIATQSLSGPTVGIAQYRYDSGNDLENDVAEILEAAIFMDLEPTWSPKGENNELSYYAVLLHEIGHAIGLAHVVDETEVMHTPISVNGLGDGDESGARALYGGRYGTNGDDNDVDLSALPDGATVRLDAGNDTLIATPFADIVLGGAGNDVVNGGGGNDLIIDALGTNILNGDDDDDVIIGGGRTTADGGLGRDIILGGSGDDILSGGAGADTLIGDPVNGFFYGDDRLTPGAGVDFIAGGGGADVFVFAPDQDHNTIGALEFNLNDPTATRAIGVDFESGIDKIDVSAFGGDPQFNAYGAVQDVGAGAGATAHFNYDNTTIVFYGLTKSDLTESDFLI